MPKPKPGEKQADFVSRCIRQLTKLDPKRDPKQIQAICFGQWRKRKQSFEGENMKEKDYKKDEDGNFIIAENVPIIFNSRISVLKEKEEEKIDKKN